MSRSVRHSARLRVTAGVGLAVGVLSALLVAVPTANAETGCQDDPPLPQIPKCDNIAPTTQITGMSPEANSNDVVSTSSVRFTFTASDRNAYGDPNPEAVVTSTCTLELAGETKTVENCTSPVDFPVRDTGGRLYTFSVYSVDNATDTYNEPDPNKEEPPVTRSFRVDTTAPDTEILEPKPSGWQLSRSAQILYDGSGGSIRSFRCGLNGTEIECGDTYGFLALDALRSGRHRASVAAQDDLGNTDPTPATASWVVPHNTLTVSSGRWRRVVGQRYFDRDVQQTTRKGATLSKRVPRTGKVGVLVATGRDNGRIAVWFGKTRLGAASLASPREGAMVLKTFALPGGAKRGIVRIVVVSRGRVVRVDGLLAG